MSLLFDIQRLIEQIYRCKTGVNLEEFIIGRTRFDYLSQFCVHGDSLSRIARVFFRKINKNLYVAIYFDRRLVRILEKNDPRRGLNNKNIMPFIIFIEEINHAIHGALKFLEGEKNIHAEAFSRDLELLAKIDTYLLLKYFLAAFNRSKQPEMLDKLWLKYHLFETLDMHYENQTIAERYKEAVELSEKFVRFIDCLPVVERRIELKRFRAMHYVFKKQYISCLPD